MLRTVDYSQNIANTSTRILEPNSFRHYVCIVNDSDTVQYIALGQTAVANQGIRLNASGGSYEINLQNPFFGYVEAINSAGGKKLCVVEVSRA